MLLQILPWIKEDYYAPAVKLILQAFLIRNLHLNGWRGVERGVEKGAEIRFLPLERKLPSFFSVVWNLSSANAFKWDKCKF